MRISDWSSDVCSSDLLEYTRSLSRNGFAQVTAVFTDSTDIYFARQQVAERLRVAEESLPDGAVPTMGPIATGLGEVYMWTVRFQHRKEDKHKPGEPGMQPDGSYITPEGDRLVSEADQATYLRTAPDWIVRSEEHTSELQSLMRISFS